MRPCDRDETAEVENAPAASFHGKANYDIKSSKPPNNSPHLRPHLVTGLQHTVEVTTPISLQM